MAYREFLGNLSKSVASNTIRDLELGVVLGRQELGLTLVDVDRSGEAGGGDGEENGHLGEVHFVVGGGGGVGVLTKRMSEL